MHLTASPLKLTLRRSLVTSRGATSQANNVLVRISENGLYGIGEGAPIKLYHQTQQSCLNALAQMRPMLAVHDSTDIAGIINGLREKFSAQASAVAAVDIALHDLHAKQAALPLWKLWGFDCQRTPQTSLTIGIDSLDKVTQKVADAWRFPILKIKVGVENDLEIIREVRRLAPQKTLRVDANCGWSVETTIDRARKLEALGIEFIEQPIPPGNNQAFKQIKNAIGIPLIADESSVTSGDIPALAGCVDGINIKLTKCGGLLEGLKMIRLARDLGMKIMLGCMLESSILISAAAQLSPLVDYADLDGNLFLAADPYRGVTIDKTAKLILSDKPGIGCTRASVQERTVDAFWSAMDSLHRLF